MAVAAKDLPLSSHIWNPFTTTCKYTPALEGAMVMVSKAHPGPGFFRCNCGG